MIIDTRLAGEAWRCPWCGEEVLAGELITGITVDTTESSACLGCAWAAENGDLDSRRP